MTKENIMISSEPFCLFPFQLVEKDETIIIYGVGNIGKQYIEQIEKTGYCKIKYAVDKNLAGKEFRGVRIEAPEILAKENNLRVVISTFAYVDEVRKNILGLWNGIGDDRILFQEVSLNDTHYERKQLSEWESIKLDELRKTLVIKKEATGIPFCRLGRQNDGGYVMLNDFLTNNGVAYSFGISGDVSWDKDMASRGYDVYMYDHTISGLPEQNSRFHFMKIGLADSIQHDADLETLDNLIRHNRHLNQNHMILKMDVEGAEWGFIEMTDQKLLKKFDQIVMELHSTASFGWIDMVIKRLQKLNETHQCVHVHLNNYSKHMYVNSVPYAESYEVLFLNREKYGFIDASDVTLPLDIDAPCNPNRPEIVLGRSYSCE